MATGMTPTKRLIARLSLITGSTMATIIGAQSLATLDRQPDLTATPQEQNFAAPVTSTTVQSAPPSIAILRHSGQPSITTTTHSSTGSVASNSASTVIAPPQPITIAPPSPVVVSAPMMQPQAMTRSSR